MRITRPGLDRLGVALPHPVVLFLAGRVSRIEPGATMRRRLLPWAIARLLEASARNDAEVLLLAYEPDLEVFLSGAEGLGLRDYYRGHDGYRSFLDEIFESFDDPELSLTRLLDRGRTVMAEFRFQAVGRISGAPVMLNAGTVYYMSSHGLVERQDIFWQGGFERALESVTPTER